MTHKASRQAGRIVALFSSALLGAALLPSPLPAQNGNRLPPDRPAGSRNDAPLDAPAILGNGQDPISVDVLRHPIPEKARRMFRKAVNSLNSGDQEAARAQLLEMLAKYPDSAVYAHSVLGVIYVRTSRFNDAVTSFEQAASLLPHDATTHYNFGLSLACASEFDRAEQEVHKALELDPQNPSAQVLWSVLQHRKQPAN
jgi:Flp pilus assembly protein TadD